MKVKEVKLENEALIFIDDQNEEVYNIRKDLLTDKLSSGESDWINQLSEKSWVSKSILTQVAQIIKEEFPDNDIDWHITNKIIATQD